MLQCRKQSRLSVNYRRMGVPVRRCTVRAGWKAQPANRLILAVMLLFSAVPAQGQEAGGAIVLDLPRKPVARRVSLVTQDLGRRDNFDMRPVDVRLKKGANVVAITLTNTRNFNHGGWAFSFRARTKGGDLLIPATVSE